MGESLLKKFRRKAFSVNTFDKVLDSSGGTMRRTLSGLQLVLLGIGTMVGAGLFVSTGVAAKNKAGPAIIISYIIAGVSCTLSALCYAEYACEFPIAGGAFNYITFTFGEYAGWMVACQLFIEWTLANAAVAKGFSGYLANLCGIPRSIFQVYSYDFIAPSESNNGSGFGIQIDWLSPVFLAFLTGIMLLGTKESALAQNISVGIYVLIILITVIAGGTQVQTSNYSPFLPYEVNGVFRGAANVFFSYIGFDMVASMAEETLNPNRDLPIGIIGSLSAATAIYVAMSTVLLGMTSYADIDESAPFAQAFRAIGMNWAAIIVALGAVIGCTNSEFGGLMGQSRIFVTMGRAGLLPAGIAKVDAKRSVPYVAVLMSGGIAAVLALFLKIDLLMDFVSMGTLFAYMTVCIGVLWRRYYVAGQMLSWLTAQMSVFILVIIGCGLVTGFCYNYNQPLVLYITPIFMFLTIMLAYCFIPPRLSTSTFHCPWVPFVPGFGIMINLLLIGTLNKFAFAFWAVWIVLTTCVYLFYGIHHTQGEGRGTPPLPEVSKESGIDLGGPSDEGASKKELGRFQDGLNLEKLNRDDGTLALELDESLTNPRTKSIQAGTSTGFRAGGAGQLFQRQSVA